MRITLSVVFAAFSMTTAMAQIFDIPATGAWVKIHEGNATDEITQWSAVVPTGVKTRIDLVSYVEDGKRTSFYIIRSACPDGNSVASAMIKPGNALGIGIDCNGYTVAKSATVLGQVQKLPPEAAALLKQ